MDTKLARMRHRMKSWLSHFTHKSRDTRPNLKRHTPIAQLTTVNPPHLPSLPIELWIFIIREATLTTPDPLDTTQGVSFLESTPCNRRQYISSMLNKRNLSLVSKSWNSASQEFLYEFVWISRAPQAKALAHTLLAQELVRCVRPSGRYIRRLHIETPTLERCTAADLRTILDYSPRLIVYSDYRSVRRNRDEETWDPRVSPEQLFSALVHPTNNLRRLSWTNYDDISFQLHVSPMLDATAANLEYLELSFCSPHFPSIPESSLPAFTNPSSLSITLPSLRSLKVTLDNATFSTLASWTMPALTNLSVVSSDFSYAGLGFSRFFFAHGSKLLQLELGHSSSSIEEHYVSTTHFPQTIPLAEWCPNLREFICSADAEWNWTNPDWIAPHVLLPSHPRLQFIGIRDIDKRLLDDAAVSLFPGPSDAPFFPLLEQLSSLLHKEAFPSLHFIRDLSEVSDDMRRRKVKDGIQLVGVMEFWAKVLGRCRDRGVWLEDCRGVNVTARDLKRASLSLE